MDITSIMMKQRRSAYAKNLENILACIGEDPDASLCDLGCDDGEWTLKLANKCKTMNLYGVEIIEERRMKAVANGVKALQGNLNEKLPYNDNHFDVVHANQVIEHLVNVDIFLSEINRVLKPGGYFVVSTENLASWHNVFALMLGYMPFSLSNTTEKTADLGNPLAPHHGEEFYESTSWLHKTVFTTKGLAHLLKLHDFNVSVIRGSGYYPFGNVFSSIDIYHCAFVTMKAIKVNLPKVLP